MASQSPCIFLTGATGFVGGTILSALCNAHPEAHIEALIRREEDAKHLQSIHPNLQPVLGSLSDLDLLRRTAASVDFVIYTTKEDIPAVLALIDGLASKSSTHICTPRLISISGTRSLIDLSAPVTGIASDDSEKARPWSDITDIKTILSLPHSRIHAEADQSILAHAIASGVGTMRLAPGQLWGRGNGHVKTEGAAAAAYYAAVKKRERAFVIGDGSVAWSWSSIGDLGEAVVFLMDQALSNDQRVGVNEEGYYFLQTDDVKMKDRAEAISARLGLGDVESIAAEIAGEYHPFGPLMWGCGATFRADRLRQLGWSPKDVDWKALMEERDGERA
jgi:nucleoside-diphosphate-sugar epimerase